jgi:hypothetical protein
MNALTATELLILNGMSHIRNMDVSLGDTVQALIAALNATETVTGTPVNAVNAKAALTLTGVAKHGEMVTIGEDVYEFVADTAKTTTDPANIPVDIKASATASSGTLTMATQPTAGDTVTIGGSEYIFVPVGTDTAPGEVSVGANVAEAQAALVAAINGTDDDFNDPHPFVRAGAFADNVSVITALIGGTAGDEIATTETFTAAGNLFGATTLGSGADCTAAHAVTALVTAITASDTQGVGAADGTGDVVDLTADAAGVAGNEIAVATTMTHASFGADVDSLSGGVNGTVGDKKKLLVDASYLYICPAGNTISGKNWRRISLGSAY